MKRTALTYKTLILLVLLALASSAHAADVAFGGGKQKQAPTTPIIQEKPAEPEGPKTALQISEESRVSFGELITKFTSFITRTQTTIDRLSTKGIDVTKSQEALMLANTSLEEATKAASGINKIVIPENASVESVPQLRDTLKRVDETLKETRTHLIESLLILKESLTPTAPAAQ